MLLGAYVYNQSGCRIIRFWIQSEWRIIVRFYTQNRYKINILHYNQYVPTVLICFHLSITWIIPKVLSCFSFQTLELYQRFHLVFPFNHLNYTKGSILFFLSITWIIPKVPSCFSFQSLELYQRFHLVFPFKH
jgi:hypothetical protein